MTRRNSERPNARRTEEVEARLRGRAARAKFVLLLELLVAAFWPLPVLVIFFLSVAFFDLLPHLPGWLHVLTLGGFLSAAA